MDEFSVMPLWNSKGSIMCGYYLLHLCDNLDQVGLSHLN